MRTILWLLPAGMVLLALVSAGAQQSTVKPVATVKQLHEAMITPSSDALFDVGREAPKDDKAWAALRNNAVILAESGNLLMLAGRAKDNGAWMKLSRELVDSGVVALKAAEAKNVDALLKAGDVIVPVCEKCHEVYRDRPQDGGAPPCRRVKAVAPLRALCRPDATDVVHVLSDRDGMD